MKKIIVLLGILVTLSAVVYIFAVNNYGSNNYIRPYTMSKNMEEIVSLSNMNEPVTIFDYSLKNKDGFIKIERLKLDENYQWQVIEEGGIGSSNIGKGKLAIDFNREEDKFRFALKSKGYGTRDLGKDESKKIKREEEFYFGMMNRLDKTEVFEGERIILMVSYSSDGNYYDYDKEFFTNHEKLKDLNEVECIAITFQKRIQIN